MITPRQFVDRWAQSKLREQQAAQSHFNELCQLVGHKTPAQLDPEGKFFTFEENVAKATGGRGRADVWYKGHFAWEYKGKHKSLDEAYQQLSGYAGGLYNPPLLIVCDFNEYRIYPHFINVTTEPMSFTNEDLLNPRFLRYIAWALERPEKFVEPHLTDQEERERLTLILATRFAELTDLMRRQRDQDGKLAWGKTQIARFLTKLIFALFVEDIELLPHLSFEYATNQPVKLISHIAKQSAEVPASFVHEIRDLFEAMNGDRPSFQFKPVPYFNGGLFEDSQPGAGDGLEVLNLAAVPGALSILQEVCEANWRFVNPTIFGTLFEGALDESKRAQLGTHFTSEAHIRLVIEPVLMQPLYRRWETIRTQAESLMRDFQQASEPRARLQSQKMLEEAYNGMMRVLENTRVLDPACGSGNFLYMSLRAMKDLEAQVREFFVPLGLHFHDVVTPRQLYGIEKDEFAARLARVVVWCGYLQWRYEDEGFLRPVLSTISFMEHPRQLPHPIIQDKLSADDPEHIVNADAIMRYDADDQPYEPDWPEVDVIVGNPPFLGDKRMRSELGDQYVDDLRGMFQGRVPGGADLVTYWYEKSRALIEKRKDRAEHTRAGLLATQSIRVGANRSVLDRIKETGNIFLAWSDRAWVLQGASVRISIVGFDDGIEQTYLLDGAPVLQINSDLQNTIDATKAQLLSENANLAFIGTQKGGDFDIDAELAEKFLKAKNISGANNSEVVFPWINGSDIVQRPRSMWIIDFGAYMTETDAQKYELPYEHVKQHVLPSRANLRRVNHREKWWLHAEARPGMRKAMIGLSKYIVTPRVASHRVFVWENPKVVPDSRIVAITRDDDFFFGVLHSYIHEIWALRLASWHGVGNDPTYNAQSCFETFPFPWSPGKEDTAAPAHAAISAAAQTLHTEREAWLNPPHLLALGANADSPALRERTLTNLYNAVAAFRRDTIYRVPTPDPADPLGTGRASEGETSERNGNGSRIPKSARDFAPRLAQLHDALDRAVLTAYGWDDLFDQLRTPNGDEELLRRLLALNLERSS